jgi:flagellar hook-associated protein 3 FlgL
MRISNLANFKHQVQLMMEKNRNINQLFEQVSTGKKINKVSDDPVTANKISSLNIFMEQLVVYEKNITTADNRLTLTETTVRSMVDASADATALISQAQTTILGNSDRANLAAELESLLDQMVGLANTKDASGEFIFSGLLTNVQPYVDNGGISYQGDQGQRAIALSSHTSVIYADSGFDVFENVRAGNGTFVADTSPSVNTGTGVIDPGRLIDKAAYVPDTYTITFVTNGLGQLAYNVVGASTGQIIPALPQDPVVDAPAYVDGQVIQFNGMETSITGQPNVGDDFQVRPSPLQNIFTTLENVVDLLKTPINTALDQAEYNNTIRQNAASFKQAQVHLNNFLAEIGSRLQTVEGERNLNQSFTDQSQITTASLQEVFYPEAVSLLEQEIFALQISQQSFQKVQDLTLFNFLR